MTRKRFRPGIRRGMLVIAGLLATAATVHAICYPATPHLTNCLPSVVEGCDICLEPGQGFSTYIPRRIDHCDNPLPTGQSGKQCYLAQGKGDNQVLCYETWSCSVTEFPCPDNPIRYLTLYTNLMADGYDWDTNRLDDCP